MFKELQKDIKYRIKNLSFIKGDLKRRHSVVFLFTGFLLSMIGLIITVIVQDPFWIAIPNILIGTMCFIIPFSADDITKPTKIALYVVAFLFLPFLYISMGGLKGSGYMYFIMITVYFSFFLQGKQLLFTISILLIYYASIIFASYKLTLFDIFVFDEAHLLIHSLFGLISVSSVIAIIASATFREYKIEQHIIERLMKELEQQNQKLLDLSIRDSLTEVYNRRHLINVLEKEINYYKKYHQSFHVLMIDVDNFKEINDEFGHLFGDQVLRKVAKEITKSVRDYDLVSRYGGEEFCVIVSHLNPEDSIVIAERIRMCIEKIVLRDHAKVTVSIGVAMYNQQETKDDIIKKADNQLYLAKSKGKNCVCFQE